MSNRGVTVWSRKLILSELYFWTCCGRILISLSHQHLFSERHWRIGNFYVNHQKVTHDSEGKLWFSLCTEKFRTKVLSKLPTMTLCPLYQTSSIWKSMYLIKTKHQGILSGLWEEAQLSWGVKVPHILFAWVESPSLRADLSFGYSQNSWDQAPACSQYHVR